MLPADHQDPDKGAIRTTVYNVANLRYHESGELKNQKNIILDTQNTVV